MAFTPEEKAKVRAYLGYPIWSGGELVDRMMIPAGATTFEFVLEGAFDRVLPDAEWIVRQQIAVIDCIVQQRIASYGMQQVLAVRGVQFAGIQGILATCTAYTLETDHLADMLHVPKFSSSLLHHRLGGTGEGAVEEPC